LKERSTQINASGIAVRTGKAGEVKKRKQVTKVNIGDRGAGGHDHESGHTNNNSSA
jgi:hypothetical protein